MNKDPETDAKHTTDEMIAKYIAKQITDTDSDNRLIKKITSATALLAAIATLVGAASAWNSSNKAETSAENIEDLLVAFNKSESLDAYRQKLINENGELINIYPKSYHRFACNSISLANTQLWGSYEKCIYEKSKTNATILGSPTISTDIRIACGIEVKICEKQSNN